MDYLMELRERWWSRTIKNCLENREIVVKARALTPKEAIGILYGDVKVCLIGFQPAILYGLSRKFNNIRTTDMNEKNINKNYYGIIIES